MNSGNWFSEACAYVLAWLKDPHVDTLHSLLSLLNNVVQFLLLMAAVFGLVYLWRNSAGFSFLRKVFRGKGLPLGVLLQVLWTGRRMGQHGVRLFAEIAILRGASLPHEKDFWKERLREFIEITRCPLDAVTVDVPTVLDLENTEVRELVAAYFAALPTFGKQEERFLCGVAIREGFISLLLPLPVADCGTDAEEGERCLRERRLRLVQSCAAGDSPGAALRRLQIYLLFEWLIWKPSYTLAGQNNAPSGRRLVSYGLSDEAGALSLVLPPGRDTAELYDTLKNQKATLGLARSLTATVARARWYYAEHMNDFSGDALPLLDYGKNDDAVLLVYRDSAPLPAGDFVYTAYLWLLLAREDGPGGLDMERSICFWEHANLADPASCAFFSDLLIKKCFAYCDKLFAMPDNQERYRFAFAANPVLEERFQEEFAARRNDAALGKAYRTRLLGEPRYGFGELLHAVRNLAPSRHMETRFVEVDSRDSESLRLLCRFYAEIMIPEFPPDERESLENIIASLAWKHHEGQDPPCHDTCHVLLLLCGDELAGGTIFDYSAKANCGFLEYIALNKNFRGSGAARQIWEKSLELLHNDARKAGKALGWVLAETEKDKISAETEGSALAFFRRCHFSTLRFPYVQPPLTSEKQPTRDLILLTRTFAPDWPGAETGTLPTSALATALCEYARIAMRRDIPEQDPVIAGMLATAASMGHVPVDPLPGEKGNGETAQAAAR